MFYRHERKLLRCGFDMQGKLTARHLYYLAGLTIIYVRTSPVDIIAFIKGKKTEKQLPNVPTLYDNYVSWGIIPASINEGMNNFVKLGLVFDSRDNEANPMHGIWSEAVLAVFPSFINGSHNNYVKFAIIHRQYFTLFRNSLSFAYRIGYQGKIAGNIPFYMQPVLITSFSHSTTLDGLGGAITIRGILRNRVVGDGMAYLNSELRWKAFYFKWLKQYFYFGVNAFLDMGMVLDKTKINMEGIPSSVNLNQYFSTGPEVPHISLGCGIRLAMNQNFIISIDFGKAIDKRDGNYGLYGGVGYLF